MENMFSSGGELLLSPSNVSAINFIDAPKCSSRTLPQQHETITS
jgi:hypothetical protein